MKQSQSLLEPRYKSKVRMMLMGLIISMSGISYGYGLSSISTVPIKTFIRQYQITIPESVTQSLLIGIMPATAAIGAILSAYLIVYFKRRTLIYIAMSIMLVSTTLMEITTMTTLLLGRAVEGVAIGIFVSISPVYLRQLIAKQLRPQISAMFSFCKVFGIVLAYSLSLALAEYSENYRILIGFNGVIAAVQGVLTLIVMKDSPVELIDKGDKDTARDIVSSLYRDEFVEEVYHEYAKIGNQAVIEMKVKDETGQEESIEETNTKAFQTSRKNARKMGFHLAILRQFIGGNCLVTFSGPIIGAFSTSLQKYTPLTINLIQLFANGIALVFITKTLGRRPIFLFGVSFLIVINLLIAVALIVQDVVPIAVGMSLYMLIYGGTFLPVAWSYPSQIMTAEYALLPNIVNWIATSIVTSVPPLVVGAMPNGNAYPLFFFFAAYSMFGLYYIYKRLVESKGLTYFEIVKQY